MTVIIRGRKVEYGVEEATGIFGAEWNGEQFRHATLTGLKSAIERQMKKKPLSIPVIRLSTDRYSGTGVEVLEFTKGTIVGVHSANRNLRVIWEGNSSPEQYSPRWDTLLRGNADVKKLKMLHKAVLKATTDYEEVKDTYRFKEDIPYEGEPE